MPNLLGGRSRRHRSGGYTVYGKHELPGWIDEQRVLIVGLALFEDAGRVKPVVRVDPRGNGDALHGIERGGVGNGNLVLPAEVEAGSEHTGGPVPRGTGNHARVAVAGGIVGDRARGFIERPIGEQIRGTGGG